MDKYDMIATILNLYEKIDLLTKENELLKNKLLEKEKQKNEQPR